MIDLSNLTNEENREGAFGAPDPKDVQIKKLIQLREKFNPNSISSIPKGNTTLDYVGHAAVTDRLLQVDPFWNWEFVSFEENGSPRVDKDANGKICGLWIQLTVCGVTRYGYGTCLPGKNEAVKELIGDAIRNAAMRFGVALDLWSKDELESNTAPSIDAVLTGFRQLGVDRTRVEKRYKKPIEQLTAAEINELVDLGKSIREGRFPVEDAFPPVKVELPAVSVKTGEELARGGDPAKSPKPKK